MQKMHTTLNLRSLFSNIGYHRKVLLELSNCNFSPKVLYFMMTVLKKAAFSKEVAVGISFLPFFVILVYLKNKDFRKLHINMPTSDYCFVLSYKRASFVCNFHN